MNRRLLLPFSLSAALHATALAAVLASLGGKEERASFTVEVVLTEPAGSQGTSGGAQAASASSDSSEANAMPDADPSRRDFAEREIAPQDEAVPLERPHPEEPDVASTTSEVSKDGPRVRSSDAVVLVSKSDTTETSRSSRRRQAVAVRPIESKSTESRAESVSPAAAAAATPASPEQLATQAERGSGPGFAGAADASTLASGSAEKGGEAVHRVEPAYPMAARRRGLEGAVVLRVRFDAEGRPEDVVVKIGSGSEMLDSAAREAVLRWRFRGGSAGFVDVPITFRLRGTQAVQVSDAASGRKP